MYPSQAILYPCPFYYHDSYDLSVQSVCHSYLICFSPYELVVVMQYYQMINSILVVHVKQLIALNVIVLNFFSSLLCSSFYRRQTMQSVYFYMWVLNSFHLSDLSSCSICKYIFIQSEQEPQLQLIKPTTTFSKDPQNPSIHFYLKTNQQRNNIGTIKSYSSTTKEPADISAVISLFTSIQIYFDRVYMPATGNSLLSQYIYLYMSFIASHLILKSWNLEPIFTFLSSSSVWFYSFPIIW